VVGSDRNVALAGTGSGVFFTEVGKNVPSVPQNTFSFWNKYDVSSYMGLGPGVLGVGSGVVYNSKFFAALDNAVIVPGYARWDGAVYLKISDNFSGQVNVENILGAMYYASAQNNNNITPGAPRSAYVTVNARF
jgi:catecholate siderophore receptor